MPGVINQRIIVQAGVNKIPAPLFSSVITCTEFHKLTSLPEL